MSLIIVILLAIAAAIVIKRPETIKEVKTFIENTLNEMKKSIEESSQHRTPPIPPLNRNPSVENKSIDIAHNSDFYRVNLLNHSEIRVFNELQKYLKSDFFIYPQVSLGEIIKAKNKNISAFNIINSKRVDFLIVNQRFNPIIAIEYHGQGHYRGNYKVRDEVKRITLEKAGIIYLAIRYDDDDLQTVKNKITRLLEDVSKPD
ncbi:DUF2726 domain-containing protein [Ignatzschineria sp. RMDPL8A]|uniref:DUF2726 domain-containing protein n=1 Tax=Ignatzschineria sp. RMDPL8A TaxID=2999236 RepID=UPI0024467DA7|nr:DUF2726 domain-containing protein [Ignatzschineria sp. RMDPL8A]MDG9730416.1 DUF2726 domain-containing protein [Ignatzschineria sp. RMDPL8A]